MKPIVIIGSGMAGYTLAREFRKLDKTRPVTLISADRADSYSKPMLSNALTKNREPEDLVIANAAAMAAQLDINIETDTRVINIDPDAHEISTAQGTRRYSQLVLATGAAPVTPGFEGNSADAALQINSLADYTHFRQQLKKARSVTIIGAGLIGCEFANDLVNQGFKVHLIGLGETPLNTLIPQPAGEAMQSALTTAGVTWHLGTTVTAIDSAVSGYRISLGNHASFQTDLILTAIGLRPHTSLAANAGLETCRGIVTNNRLQTSNTDIYALGDCAEIEGKVLPFVMPLMIGARALAKTLAGTPSNVDYPVMPIVVKTPDFPQVIVPGSTGEWYCDTTGSGIRCLQLAAGKLSGFCLGGDATAEKQALLKQLGQPIQRHQEKAVFPA